MTGRGGVVPDQKFEALRPKWKAKTGAADEVNSNLVF